MSCVRLGPDMDLRFESWGRTWMCLGPIWIRQHWAGMDLKSESDRGRKLKAWSGRGPPEEIQTSFTYSLV